MARGLVTLHHPCSTPTHTAPPTPTHHTCGGPSHASAFVFCRYLNDIFTLEIREGMSLQWVCPTIEGPCPTPRESHSAIAYGSKLIVFGGMNGRRLGDCWMLDTGEQHCVQPKTVGCGVM